MFQATTSSPPPPLYYKSPPSVYYLQLPLFSQKSHYNIVDYSYSSSQLRLQQMMHMKKAMPLYRTQWGPGYNRAPSKVVSIPVHFVGSDSERSRTESGTKIQRVARGFLVRKSVRKMVGMRVELEQIEKKVNDPETVEALRREAKERARVGETIMNLLLRLDSVRVFHYSPLRDLRKSLVKRAIALQELVDQMVGVGVGPTHEDQQLQGNKEEEEGGNEGECAGEESLVEEKEEEGQVGCGVHEEGEKMEALRNEEVEEKEKEGKCVGGESVGTSLVEEGKVGGEEHEEGEEVEGLRNEEKTEVEEEEEDGDGGCVGEESVGTSLVEEDCVGKEGEGGIGCEEENCKGGRGRGDEGYGGNRELLDRMMEDNEKMMAMMAQLFHRNEMQTRLLSSLTQRVEQLERAFACDKLRKKKKRNVDVKHRQNGCT